ncbi:MAG: GEVED domain-containing protein [Pirellulaceae bacterium]
MATSGFFKSRNLLARKRLEQRSSVRRALLETLEQRQLLAVGPQLLGIQPNTGDLLQTGDVLHQSPKELVFRFDDAAGIDPSSLDGIRIVRSGDDGVFERAVAATDFSTGGQTLVEFYAQEAGETGNGIQVEFSSRAHNQGRAPIVTVEDRIVRVELNSNPLQETRVEDLLQAFDPEVQSPATSLVYALRLRGSQTIGIGATGAPRTLVLGGANAAKASTNFNISNELEVRFIAKDSGNAGLGINISVTSRDRGGAGNPIVTVSGKNINVEINSNTRFPTTVQEFVNALNASDSLSSALVEAQLVSGVGATRLGTAPINYSPIELGGVSDVEIIPAYVGLGDTDREVIVRFADPLPDDRYRIEILGQGTRTLRNVNGEAFNCAISQSVAFELDLGAQVESVVPQPVTRSDSGQLVQQRNVIDVYFNDDDLIDVRSIATVNGLTIGQLRELRTPFFLDSTDTIVFNSGAGTAAALNASFYQLYHTSDSLDSDDDSRFTPSGIRYYPATDRVTLTYSRNLDQLTDGTGSILPAAELRLRIGSNEDAPLEPATVDGVTSDPQDTFAGALDLTASFTPGAGGTQSVLIDGEILNTSPLLLDFPGGSDEPGNRQNRYQDNLRLTADSEDGTSTVFYNFQTNLGVFSNSNLVNAITEQQKLRVREVLSIYESYLGIRFVETESTGFTVAVGDMRAITPFEDVIGSGLPGVIELNGPGGTYYEAGTLVGNGQLGTVLDLQDFNQSDRNGFGGPFQRAAMQAVGRLLGLGLADEAGDLTIQSFDAAFAPGVGTEIILPGDTDIVHGQFLYRPDSKDIDLYQFALPVDGRISIEAFAERMSTASLLDSQVVLYQQDDNGGWDQIAANDDYYSSDSYLELDLEQGNYIIGVSASGNRDYDPTISDTGIGGRSQGDYQLRVDFQPPAAGLLVDGTGTAFDGDADGTPEGIFNFWFRPSGPNNTQFVDKTAAAGGTGSIASPYNNIGVALAQAQPGDVVRIVGNGGTDGELSTADDNLAYEIGFDTLGRPLEDGATLDVPRDVSVMIDAGAILKMRRSRIGVGSTSTNVDRSAGSLLVLGTPTLLDSAGNAEIGGDGEPIRGSVVITSINDSSVAAASGTVDGSAPNTGDWGGVDFRLQVDASVGSRENQEDLGQFLNWISHADIRYGGGQVVVDGVSETINSVQMVDARPTIVNSTISNGSGSAISATPNSFLETNFHSPAEQGVESFTVDYHRAGPDLSGNQMVNNAINGLQIRTNVGDEGSLTVPGRFDDSDVVHYIPENLTIAGTPGGAVLVNEGPSSSLVALTEQAGGALDVGIYNYRFTSIDTNGVESTPSEPTNSIFTFATGSVILSNLPLNVNRIYRSTATGEGPYELIAEFASNSNTFIDAGTSLGTILADDLGIYATRQDARLAIDPGVVLKFNGSRIDVDSGAQLIAEGSDGNPVVFTSVTDSRYGAGGTFQTANNSGAEASPGDWGGIYVGHTSSASLDNTVISYGGGSTRIDGDFADFAAVESHQGTLRLTNSRLENNESGSVATTDEDRSGRGSNDPATIFVRGAQPVIVNNIIQDNLGPAISINVGSLNSDQLDDYGRATGLGESFDNILGNQGPLISDNRLSNNVINGVVVRGGQLVTEGVWDDTDIVHVVTEEIVVPDHQHFSGLRLASSSEESLVVKLDGAAAGFTATGQTNDNDDRIGGSVQVIGTPDHPVVLTSIEDCTVGAGFAVDGQHQVDTNNSGRCGPVDEDVDFVDVIVVMDESGSMFGAQQFAIGLIADLDANLQAAGIGSSAAGINLFGLVGFGGDPADARSIPVGTNGDLFGTSQEYATASANLTINGFQEDGYDGINFALDTYEFREDAEKFIILVTDEPRNILDASLTFDSTRDRLEAADVTLEGILSVFITDNQGSQALALDSADNAYSADGNGGFTTSPNGSILFGFGTTVTDYADLAFETGGIVGDINQIAQGGVTAESFGNAVISSIVTQAGGILANPGDWRSVLFDTHSNDRNVAATFENELTLSDSPDTNRAPANAEFLGSIAPNLDSGDENQRLGFQVTGQLSNPSDVDVYSFHADAGTEVWLDIDRTDNSLDTVIELVDANGRILALSDNSLAEEADSSLLFSAAELSLQSVNPLRKSDPAFYFTSALGNPKDLFSTNPRDAGMRVRLPGDLGTNNLYHIRVRSSNLGAGDPVSNLLDPALTTAGLTSGSYQLQVRLSEEDEVPGSSIRYADIRYATNGVQLVGVPGNSPLVGENGEIENIPGAARNDSFANAQDLGNILDTNRQAISVAGNLDNLRDIDWYSFDIQYENITPTALREYFSTILDIDYADGVGRADTSIYVYNAAGNLILSGLNSNLVDDQSNPAVGVNSSGLAAGSFGGLDPFIGPYELPAGQYFVAITNSELVPSELAGFTDPNFADPEMRLLPVEGVELIAEDHIELTGGTTAALPRTPILFPTAGDFDGTTFYTNNNDSIVDFNLNDVALYVSQDVGQERTNIYIVNPFTGETRSQVGRGNFDVQDIDFRPNGDLRAYDRVVETNIGNADADTFADYIDIDSGTGVFTDVGDLGLETTYLDITAAPPASADANDGFNVEAITFAVIGGEERGFVVGNRPTPPGELPSYSATSFIDSNNPAGFPGFDRPGISNFTNVIYEIDETNGSGAATSDPAQDKTDAAIASGAGTAIRERGRIETFTLDGVGNIVTQSSRLLAREVTSGSVLTGANRIIQDGDQFSIVDGATPPNTTVIEFDLGPQVLVDYAPSQGSFITDGMTFNLDGIDYEFDTGSVIVIDALNGTQIPDGATVRIANETGTVNIFEFDNNGQVVGAGNIAVEFDPTSTQAQLVDALAGAINSASFGVTAQFNPNSNRISLIGASTTAAVEVTGGSGLSIDGTVGVTPGNARIPISEAASLSEFILAISQNISSGVTVGFDAGRMNFSGATSGSFIDLENAGIFTDLQTDGNVSAGAIAVPALASDTAETVAARIAKAVNDAGIPALSATANGNEVQFAGALVSNQGPLEQLGIAPGGIVTGIAVTGNTMFAVSDAGGLYRVDGPRGITQGNVGSYVETSFELVGIPFSGLVEGPTHLQNGEFAQLLFGIDQQGNIHAFNTAGELQPVFANGQTSIATGLTGANGLTLSSLDFNLWHVDGQRSGDDGHGLPATPNDSREEFTGGQSLYFGFNNPGVNGVGDLSGANATGLADSYNFPGGAAGAIESASFDLSSVAPDDLPTLYFSYFFETEDASSDLATGNNANDYMRDSLRVYASGESGEWILLATNNDPVEAGSNSGTLDDEFDPFLTGNADVQPLHDNVGAWRQARVPLNVFAGQEEVRLRIEFSSNGGFGYGLEGGRGPEIRTISGDRLVDGETLIVNGRAFEIELGPTLNLPAGSSISNGETVTIEGVNYVFTDGSLAVGAPDVAVNYDTTMGASEIAVALGNAIAAASIAPPVSGGFSFTNESNDTIARAELSGITGESVRVIGTGEIGDNGALTDAGEDVDLVRIDVARGATVTVGVAAESIGSGLDSLLRVFDSVGNQLFINDDFGASTDSSLSFTATEDGTYYIGVSGAGNVSYNPAVEGSSVAGSTGEYELTITVQKLLNPVVAGNRLQLEGSDRVGISAGSAISLQGLNGSNGLPVFVTLDMTADEVAAALQESLANFFAGGATSAYARTGNVLDLTGLVNYSSFDFFTGTATPSLNDLDPGPFGATTNFVGDAFSAFNSGTNFDGTTNNNNPGALGAQNNDFEGVYLDDFVIGVAGRGEMVLASSTTSTNFIVDPQLALSNPDQINVEILVGEYQLEIRGGADYGIPTLAGFPDTLIVNESIPFDSRSTPGLSIQFNSAASMVAGQTFLVGDGTTVLTFELDDVNDNEGVAAGNVALPFNTALFDPVSGASRSETAQEIAARFRDIINSSEIQDVLEISANLLNNDSVGATSSTVVLVGNATAALDASIGEVIITQGEGGGANRERTQGQIVIDSAIIRESQDFGISIASSAPDPVTGISVPGTPRNLIALNAENLAPGAVVMNSELISNSAGGISITGPNADPTLPPSATPFVRLVNNSIVGGTVTAVSALRPLVFGGQLFDVGSLAFADDVVTGSYQNLAGGGPPPAAGLDDPIQALGAPNFSGSGEPQADEGVVSLGPGGLLTLQFTNNFLTGSGNADPDLMLFEVGDSEEVNVSVSVDGVRFTDVGRASAASPLIDIDAFGFDPNSRIGFVRLEDVVNQGSTTGDSVGADIDAIGALSSVPAENATPGGTGVSISNNATATLLNNVIINSTTGITVDTSSASTVVGGTVYQRNVANVAGSATLGQFPTVLDDNVPVFVSAGANNLYPAPGSPIIDASIDSLGERPSLAAVKAPLGIPSSPILAPQYDINGQLRLNDPNVEAPSGLGENIFKDRGAQDRADFVGPSVILQNPVDNDNAGLDANSDPTIVELTNINLNYFDIRLIDGIAPSDPSTGTGVNHDSISPASVLVFRNGEPLVEGLDYRFGYDFTNGVIRLQPLAGVWQTESVYTIRFVNSGESSVIAQTGSNYDDGDQFTILDKNSSETIFEIDLGYVIDIPTDNGIDALLSDGNTFVIDDGVRRFTYELDGNGSTAAGNIPVSIGTSPTVIGSAAALQAAIEGSAINVRTQLSNGRLQILSDAVVQLDADTSELIVTGSSGVQTVFGLQIPLEQGAPVGVADGQTFTIDRSGSPVTFEFDTNGTVLTGNVPVQFPANASAAQIGAALVVAIDGAGLGLSPAYDGNGLVRLGGDSNTGLDLTNTVLTQTGVAGSPAAIKIEVPLDTSANGVAEILKSAIENANLPDVTITQFGTRLIISDIEGISGVGANLIDAIRDLAGNPLKPNQTDGTTTLTVFMGEGFDYGDAGDPYSSTAAQGGPRHTVTPELSLGATATVDADAKLVNADQDDGVTFTSLFAAFQADANIDVTNTTGSDAFVSMWIDFNNDGFFATSENVISAQVMNQPTTVSFLVPSSATAGETYARIRISTDANAVASPNGDAIDGEVEDHLLTLNGNPYTNGVNNLDVNGDGFVSPIDALQVRNYVNDPSNPTTLSLPAPGTPPFVDVNGDGSVSAIDVLLVINFLNEQASGGSGEGEALVDGSLMSQALDFGMPETVLASDWANGLENMVTRVRRHTTEPTYAADIVLQDEDPTGTAETLSAEDHISHSPATSGDLAWADFAEDDEEEDALGSILDELF